MLTIDTTIEWLGKFNEKIQENKAYLSELDGRIGSFKLWKCLRNL